MRGINIKGAINTKMKSCLVAPSIHLRRHQRLLCRQTKPGTAGWSIHNKGSEVSAVKRLLTSHFICQTFISLFMVQCTPSAQARVHTCAWSTFKAFLPTFHDLADKRKMPDFRADAQTDELFANNKRRVGNSGFSCSFESGIIKISDCKTTTALMGFALSAMCRCAVTMPARGPVGRCTFLHTHAYLCLCASVAATRTPAGDTWPRRCHGLCCEHLCGLAERRETLCVAHPGGEGLPAYLLWCHLGPCVCGSPTLDPLGSTKCRRTSAISTSWWREKATPKPPIYPSLYVSINKMKAYSISSVLLIILST